MFFFFSQIFFPFPFAPLLIITGLINIIQMPDSRPMSVLVCQDYVIFPTCVCVYFFLTAHSCLHCYLYYSLPDVLFLVFFIFCFCFWQEITHFLRTNLNGILSYETFPDHLTLVIFFYFMETKSAFMICQTLLLAL